jgi:hypothetical protein
MITGTHASIGPFYSQDAREPPVLEDQDGHTKRRSDREQIHQRSLERDDDRPEDHEEQQRREQDHQPEEQR